MTEIEGSTGRPTDTKVAHILYLMHGLAPFTFWLLALAAIIVGAMNRDSVRGTWVDTHYSWLSRTFWWGLLWIVIAGIITFILVITVTTSTNVRMLAITIHSSPHQKVRESHE